MAGGIKVGGLALNTVIALSVGVTLWFVLAGNFPKLASFVRGP